LCDRAAVLTETTDLPIVHLVVICEIRIRTTVITPTILVYLEVREETPFAHLEIGSIGLPIPVCGIALETLSATVILDFGDRVLDMKPTRFAGRIELSIESNPLLQFVICSTRIACAGTPWGNSPADCGAAPKSDVLLCHLGRVNSSRDEQIRFWESKMRAIIYPQVELPKTDLTLPER